MYLNTCMCMYIYSPMEICVKMCMDMYIIICEYVCKYVYMCVHTHSCPQVCPQYVQRLHTIINMMMYVMVYVSNYSENKVRGGLWWVVYIKEAVTAVSSNFKIFHCCHLHCQCFLLFLLNSLQNTFENRGSIQEWITLIWWPEIVKHEKRMKQNI